MFFDLLENINNFLWGYIGVALILTIGIYLTILSGGAQIRRFGHTFKNFKHYFSKDGLCGIPEESRGTDPLKAFFASIGGCIGIGNIATVSVAVQIGGPGALVWVWIVALIGMIIKYAEIYLGVKFRVRNKVGGYDGGPMYFLRKAFPKNLWLVSLMALLLCVYGVEVFMFGVIKDSVTLNYNVPEWVTISGLLALIFWGVVGGVERIGTISSYIIPIFVLLYLGMTLWVIALNASDLPFLLAMIFKSAFVGHAPVGGFAGAGIFLTISKGISSACYSGDIGIGYASIIHSETKLKNPAKQASLSIFGIFLDTFIICTCSILLVIVTGVWKTDVQGALLVQEALSQYFPYVGLAMPVFFFLTGYSTIVAYMVAGAKCSKFLSKKYGTKLFYVYAFLAFVTFSFFKTEDALILMNIAGGGLMLINLTGIFKLRHKINYKF